MLCGADVLAQQDGARLLSLFESERAAYRREIIDSGACGNLGQALVLLRSGTGGREVSRYIRMTVPSSSRRELDTARLYELLICGRGILEKSAEKALRGELDKFWSTNLPVWVSLDIPFDPWDYSYTGIPTENMMFNGICNRLLDTIAEPGRIYSDGHTAAEYRFYWEDAFRKFAASRVTHGFREWDSSIYIHILLECGISVYNCLPAGPTRDAAGVFIDCLLLHVARTLQGRVWTGPHSRVYNKPGMTIMNLASQPYNYCVRWPFRLGWDDMAAAGTFRPNAPFESGLLAGDYSPPAAVLAVAGRGGRAVSSCSTGPRNWPRGMGWNGFNRDYRNPWLCLEDREDTGVMGLVYNYITPLYALGSVQNWGDYGGEWHMHCMPWNLVIGCESSDAMIFSYAGGPADPGGQGGYMTWGSFGGDWRATIFQDRGVLFSQIRGMAGVPVFRMRPSGYLERPTGEYPELLGFRGTPVSLKTRIYLADRLGGLTETNGWVLGEYNGVFFGIRPVRGGYSWEAQPGWIKGRVMLCEIDDDVTLLEVAEKSDTGSFGEFADRITGGALHSDNVFVRYESTAGDEYRFCYKTDGLPEVNGITPDYGDDRFDDPWIKSRRGSGRIVISTGNGEYCELLSQDPMKMRRTENGNPAGMPGGNTNVVGGSRAGHPARSRLDVAQPYSGGDPCPVIVNGRWGYMDRAGTLVLEPRFRTGFGF